MQKTNKDLKCHINIDYAPVQILDEKLCNKCKVVITCENNECSINRLNSKLLEQARSIKELKNNNLKKFQELESLKYEAQCLRKSEEWYKIQIDRNHKDKINLTGELLNIHSSLLSYKKHINNLYVENENLMSKNNELHHILTNGKITYDKKIYNLEQLVHDLKYNTTFDTIESLKTEIKALKQSSTEQKVLLSRIDILENQLLAKDEQSNLKKIYCKKIEVQLKDITDNLHNKENECFRSKMRLNQLAKELSDARYENNEIRRSIHCLQDRFKYFLVTHEKLKSNLEVQTQIILDLENDRKTLVNQIDDFTTKDVNALNNFCDLDNAGIKTKNLETKRLKMEEKILFPDIENSDICSPKNYMPVEDCFNLFKSFIEHLVKCKNNNYVLNFEKKKFTYLFGSNDQILCDLLDKLCEEFHSIHNCLKLLKAKNHRFKVLKNNYESFRNKCMLNLTQIENGILYFDGKLNQIRSYFKNTCKVNQDNFRINAENAFVSQLRSFILEEQRSRYQLGFLLSQSKIGSFDQLCNQIRDNNLILKEFHESRSDTILKIAEYLIQMKCELKNLKIVDEKQFYEFSRCKNYLNFLERILSEYLLTIERSHIELGNYKLFSSTNEKLDTRKDNRQISTEAVESLIAEIVERNYDISRLRKSLDDCKHNLILANNEKFFLQRLCKDLKIVLHSTKTRNEILQETLNIIGQNTIEHRENLFKLTENFKLPQSFEKNEIDDLIEKSSKTRTGSLENLNSSIISLKYQISALKSQLNVISE